MPRRRPIYVRRIACVGTLLLLPLLFQNTARSVGVMTYSGIPQSAVSSFTVSSPQISLDLSAAVPGGTINVSGANFQPGEVVDIGIDLHPLVNVVAAADGAIPMIAVTIPPGTAAGRHVIYAAGISSHDLATAPLVIQQLQPTIALNGTEFDVGRDACVSGSNFGLHETVSVLVNSATVAFGQADENGAFDICFATPTTIASGSNTVTVRGMQTGVTASTSFMGVLPLSYSSYVAGGSTLNKDSTALPLLNPGSLRARVVLTLYTRTRMIQLPDIVIQPHTRMTVNVGAAAGRGTTFGLRVQADQKVAAQVVVQRGMNTPYSLVGAPELSTTWYLAEGYTGGTFHEYLHILNPLRIAAHVLIRAVLAGGGAYQVLSCDVPARRSAALELHHLVPHANFAVVVSSATPVLIARVMTYGPGAYGATAATGIATPGTKWNFINGSIAPGASTYVLAYNPSKTTTANLTLKLYSTFGARLISHIERIAPQRRVTLPITTLIQGSAAISATFSGAIDIAASSSTPLVVEQATYYGDPNRGHTAGMLEAPTVGALTQWTFASGDTSNGARETVTLFNPNALPINVTATFSFTDSTTKAVQVSVPAFGQTIVDPGPQGYNLPAAPHGVQLRSALFPFSAQQSAYIPGALAPYVSTGIPQ